jgi:hypothetical protein
MADREIDAILNWQVKGDKTAKKSVDDLDKAVRNIKVGKLNKELQQTARELQTVRDKMRGLQGDELAKAELNAAKLEDRAAGIVKQLQRINSEASKTPEQFAAVSKSVAARGDVESQARTITGAVGYVGGAAGGEIERIANVGAEIFAVSEAIPKLGAALKDMAAGAKVAQAGATAAAAAETATGVAATTATPGLLGMAAAIGAVLLPVAAIAAVVGGAILAINALNAAERRRKEAAEAAAKAVGEQALASAELNDKVNYALAGDVQARNQILKEYADLTAKQENLWQEEAALKEKLATATTETERKAYQKSLDTLYSNEGALGEITDTVELYREAIEKLNVTTEEAQAVALAATFGTDATSAALDNLKAEAQASAAEVDRLNATLEGQQANVEQYNAQLISAQKGYDDRREKLLEDRSIKETRELEDWLEERAKASKAHQQKLIDIETQGQARVADLRGQMDSLASEVANGLADITTKTNDAVGKANADFMQSELKAVAKFHDDERKRIRDYNRQRLRDIEDWQSDLLDAEQANDVARFLQIERDGQKRLERQQEDMDTETADRDAAFWAERQAAQEALSAKVADIQASAEAERAQLLETAGQKRAALQQAVEDEIAAIETRKQAEIASYKASEDAANAARDKRMRRQAEDEALADTRAEEALQAQIAAIEEKKRAELNAIDQTRQAMIAAMQAVAKSASGLSGLNSGSSSSNSSSTSGLSGILKKNASGSARSGPVRAFANEGYVTRPTVALMGESLGRGEAEAAVKFKLNEGLAASILKRSGGGGGVIVNAPFTIANPTFGDIPTAQEVERMFNAYHDQLTGNLEQVIMNGRYNPQVN